MAEDSISDWLKSEPNLYDRADTFDSRDTNHEALGTALHNEYCRINDEQRQQLVAELTTKSTHRAPFYQWNALGNADGQRLGIVSPLHELFVSTDCEKK